MGFLRFLAMPTGSRLLTIPAPTVGGGDSPPAAPSGSRPLEPLSGSPLQRGTHSDSEIL